MEQIVEKLRIIFSPERIIGSIFRRLLPDLMKIDGKEGKVEEITKTIQIIPLEVPQSQKWIEKPKIMAEK